MPMIYRSPWTRWILAVTGLVAGALLAFGDEVKWRSTPSLHWLSHFPAPLQVWGVAMMLYALLLLFKRTRPVAFAMGAFLYAVFTVSLLATLRLDDDAPRNSIVIAAMIDVVVMHAYSIKTAELIRLQP